MSKQDPYCAGCIKEIEELAKALVSSLQYYQQQRIKEKCVCEICHNELKATGVKKE